MKKTWDHLGTTILLLFFLALVIGSIWEPRNTLPPGTVKMVPPNIGSPWGPQQGVSAMASSGLQESALHPSSTSAPWADLRLPIKQGDVIEANDQALMVQYAPAVDVEVLGAEWTIILSKGGFGKYVDNSVTHQRRAEADPSWPGDLQWWRSEWQEGKCRTMKRRSVFLV